MDLEADGATSAPGHHLGNHIKIYNPEDLFTPPKDSPETENDFEEFETQEEYDARVSMPLLLPPLLEINVIANEAESTSTADSASIVFQLNDEGGVSEYVLGSMNADHSAELAIR